MSRYHGHIVFAVVFSLFIGLIGLAEVTKVSPAPAPPVAKIIPPKKGGFNLAQVLVEQEIKSHLDKKLNKKNHQLLVLSQVKNLSQDDLTTLKTKALDRSMKWEERSACVDLLALAGDRAKKALHQIALAPLSPSKGRAPASVDNKGKEKILRSKALAALGRMSPQKVAKSSTIKNQKRLALATEARSLK